MSVTDDDVRAAATRWRAYRLPHQRGMYQQWIRDQEARDAAETLADALLAWEDRFGGEFPPGFFSAPTPRPTTKESP